MRMEIIREEKFAIPGGEIPISLIREKDEEGEFFSIEIDGVLWLQTESRMHAVVLFEIMKDHLTEYMHYEKIK